MFLAPPEAKWVGWIMLSIGSILVIFSMVSWVIDKWHKKTQSKFPKKSKTTGEHIPLKKAAADVYDAECPNNSTDITRIVTEKFRARRARTVEEGILINVGSRIIKNHLYVPIYGKRLPGNESREILIRTREHSENLGFKDGVAIFRSNLQEDRCYFSDIIIKKRDLVWCP